VVEVHTHRLDAVARQRTQLAEHGHRVTPPTRQMELHDAVREIAESVV
jgi:hypothetical protein